MRDVSPYAYLALLTAILSGLTFLFSFIFKSQNRKRVLYAAVALGAITILLYALAIHDQRQVFERLNDMP